MVNNNFICKLISNIWFIIFPKLLGLCLRVFHKKKLKNQLFEGHLAYNRRTTLFVVGYLAAQTLLPRITFYTDQLRRY